jgi:DNA primase
MLQDAGTDSNKKSGVVNQIAETISKINKAEDFTKQQDYIKQCAELLKIEETGLHALVNKFIREKVNKEENRASRESTNQPASDSGQPFEMEEDAVALLYKDEPHERAMVRSLLEFGLKTWNEQQRVADHVFTEIAENQLEDLFDNKNLITLIKTYKAWYDEGLEPTAKTFTYHEDNIIRQLAMQVMDYDYEISHNWKEVYEGKIDSREDLYKEEVFSTVNYLKLRKIKRLMDENQRELVKTQAAEEQMVLLQIHQHLKQMEIDLTKGIGTVIFR